MIEQLDQILLCLKIGFINVPEARKQILVLLAENKGVVSTSSPESVDLHGVGKSECERSDTTEASDEVVDLPLENRIDSGKICPECDGNGVIPLHGFMEADCYKCHGKGKI